MKKSALLGIGAYLPKKVLTNSDVALFVDTNDEWIVRRTGIKERRIVQDGETTSDMAVLAAKDALLDACIAESDVDLIIVATTTPDKTFPSCATLVQSQLQCRNAFAFDIQAVCSGFVYAISVADNFIKSGQVKTALIIGAETMSKIVDWKDRSTCILFGDGAGAIVINDCGNVNTGIISTLLRSDGTLNDLLFTNGGVASTGTAGIIQMKGTMVFEHAIEKLISIISDILFYNSICIDEIDLFIPHQANARIIDLVAKKLGISHEKIVMSIDKHANTSAASIPLALYDAKNSGRLKLGSLILLATIGGGLTWGACLIRL
ncbi:ketoacyl-ACP synthase III [Neoehrlichia mikurensis]|uniref:Beta-ketoacyl-[acyl-carrier-protein] synthase III n=1 Tax=Neoehrlichia mikurensis TaxID=89586 RepID=A0A9Q9C056_9RICK|nr:beta-ketoacyl-ACP synthase III [Neoehrlichia mikurensis]QXK91825.1 ketoacyl-ACP synthase III [Neoehrlichia mikurensis]QXK93038.1 ketoacyl-ACP synthase III [Neoehrlichia mikurensis]QXK93515.1 ketoacyl-ACP synthase III [Neoehrlichia mikurensis]UTO55530.1 ketoacyl-ACP synthase III [Neoehrlichia mikurensis]UTO56451.1 ketoacyl-ACP synthase III [Neoehrlichia mikurensis]